MRSPATRSSTDLLAVTLATLKTHLRNTYAKLGVTDKAAVAAALRHALIE